jgi:O-antigen/teichoic acid export membrane protein
MSDYSNRISTNFIVNLGGALVPVLVALVTVPAYIHLIGAERYGVLSIVWVLLGYFGFLDLGLSRAASNALAKVQGNGAARAEILTTSLTINAVVGGLGALCLFLFGAALLDRAIELTPSLRNETTGAMPWIALLLPLALINGVALGALESREHFVRSNLISTLGAMLGQIAPLLAAMLVAPTLSVVIPVAAVSRGIAILALVVAMLAREETLHPGRLSWARVKELMHYGGWVSVSGFLAPILSSLDQLVIARLLGAAPVAYYAVPMNLVLRTQILAASLSRTLFPRMSSHKLEDARSLAENSLLTLGFGYGSCCALGIVLIEPFLAVWIGPAFSANAALTGKILLFGAWINGLAFIPYGLLQGQGRPDVPAKFHLAQALPYVGLLLILTERFGTAGAAAAWSIRVGVDALMLAAAARFSASLLVRLCIPLAGMIGAVLASTLGTQFTYLIAAAALTIILFYVIAGIVYDPFARRLVTSAIRRAKS